MGTFNFDVGPTHYESDLVVVASALYLNSCTIQGHAVSLKFMGWQAEWFLNGSTIIGFTDAIQTYPPDPGVLTLGAPPSPPPNPSNNSTIGLGI